MIMTFTLDHTSACMRCNIIGKVEYILNNSGILQVCSLQIYYFVEPEIFINLFTACVSS